MRVTNFLVRLSTCSEKEVFEELLRGTRFRVERIVSTGQVTPDGYWYDQETAEWVILLAGAAKLRFENEPSVIELRPGDYLNIPPHCRHRVEWTDPGRETVWLAIHYESEEATAQRLSACTTSQVANGPPA